MMANNTQEPFLLFDMVVANELAFKIFVDNFFLYSRARMFFLLLAHNSQAALYYFISGTLQYYIGHKKIEFLVCCYDFFL